MCHSIYKLKSAVLLVLCHTFFSAGVEAADPPLVVMIAPVDTFEESKKTFEAVQAQLSDLEIELIIEGVENFGDDLRSQIIEARKISEVNDAITTFWTDRSELNRVFIYLPQTSRRSTGERILIRNIGAEDGSDEALQETLSLIVRSAVKTVLEGGEIGTPPPPEPEKKEKPKEKKKPAKVEQQDHLWLGVSYLGAPYQIDDTENLWIHGPSFSLSVALGKWIRLGGAYRLVMPVSVDKMVNTHEIELRLESHQFELGVSFHWSKARWSLDAGAAFLADWITKEATSCTADIITETENIWALGISPMLQAGWSPRRFFVFFLSVSLDLIINRPEYTIDDGEKNIVILNPWGVRPLVKLGIMFSLL